MNRLNGCRRTALAAIICLLAGLSGTGCGDRSEPERTDAGRATSDPTVATETTTDVSSGRSATRVDSIGVEGEMQATTLRLVEEGLPFSTYLPEEIGYERSSTAEGTTALFYAAFAGQVNRDAWLRIFVPSQLQSMKELTGKVVEMAATSGWQLEQPTSPICSWSSRSYLLYDTSAGTDAVGYVCIGSVAETSFAVITHYPEEYAEGFMPRVEKILSELRWKATGDSLGAK